MKKILSIFNSVLLVGLLLFTIMFIMLQSPLNPTAVCEPNYDSCVYLYIGEHMDDGVIPYLDTFDQKGPLQFFINYVGIQTAGYTGVWIMQIISISAAMLFSYLIARRYTSKVTAVCATSVVFMLLQLFYETGNFTEEFALPFIFAGLYLFLGYFEREKYDLTKIQILFLGFTFGCVLMLRPNMIALWLVFCTYILIRAIIKKQFKFLGRCIAFFSIGLTVSILPHIIYLGINGALKSFVNQYWFFNLEYSETTWRKRFEIAVVFIKNPISLASAAFYCITFFIQNEDSKRIVYRLLSLYYILTFVLCSMSGRLYFHYAMITLPLFIVPIAVMLQSGFDYLDVKLDTGAKRFLVVPIAILCTLILSISNLYDGLGIIKYTRTPNQNGSDEAGEIIKANTNENDKITVLQYDCVVYLEADRVSSSKYIYQYPISDVSEEIKAEYMQHIVYEKPSVIVSTKNINIEKLFYEDIYEFFINNYELLSTAGEFQIFKYSE